LSNSRRWGGVVRFTLRPILSFQEALSLVVIVLILAETRNCSERGSGQKHS